MVLVALAFVLAAGLLRSAVGVMSGSSMSGSSMSGSSMSASESSPTSSYSVVNTHRATLAVSEVYVVRAGDSLWSIVSSRFPNIDPRPLVDQMTDAVHGAALQPGERLVLP